MDRYRRDRDRDRDRDRGGFDSPPRHPPPNRRPSRFSDGPIPPQSRFTEGLPPQPNRFSEGPPHPSRFSDGPPQPSRFSDAPVQPPAPGPRGIRSPDGFRGGFGSPPRQPGVGIGVPGFRPGYRPMDGAAAGGGPGWRPVDGGEEGYGGNFRGLPPRPVQQQQGLAGQKRGFPFGGQGGSPTDRNDGNNFVKLFVGSVPRTAVEEDIRPLFEQHGKVLEIAFIKDRRTGQQQGCCFIKYGSSEEAERAIRGLHNQYTLPGGVGPIQVRFADGERERHGNGTSTTEYKLFVASLNRQATEKEVEEIFAPYGRVEEVYLMRDENRNNRGSGFVKYSNKDSAMAAINGLNGIFTMMGSDRPLIVRFAEPKRPRPGETRPTPTPHPVDPMGSHRLPAVWQTSQSLESQGASANIGAHNFGNQIPSKSGDPMVSSTTAGQSPFGGHAGNSVAGPGVPSFSTAQQAFSQPFPTPLPGGQPLPSLAKQVPSPQHYPPSTLLQPHGQENQGYAQPHTFQESARSSGQLQTLHAGGQPPYGQTPSAQYLPGLGAQLPASQHYLQQTASASQAQQFPLVVNSRPNASAAAVNSQQLPAVPSSQQLPAVANTQQIPAAQQFPLQQSSQLAEMLTQQKQSLQATLLSSQQAFSQLQQQWHMMQPTSHNQHLLPNFQAAQNQAAGSRPGVTQATEVISSAPSAPVAQTGPSSAPSAPVAPTGPLETYPIKCSWTEHTSPDGFKYYHNSSTGQSMWEKPEELKIYEQQKQKMTAQQPPQSQSGPQNFANEKTPQQFHMQTQFRHPEQPQNPSLSSSYQNSGAAGKPNGQDLNYNQSPAVPNAVNGPGRFPQGPPANQEWMWHNKSGVELKQLFLL
ncbi:Flowering time control protein FCA-like protein [Drosera capensis]